MPTDPFSILTKKAPYLGMYAGSDPYAAPEMLKEHIPTANQEALQPTDPVTKSVMAGVGGLAAGVPGIMKYMLPLLARSAFQNLTIAWLRSKMGEDPFVTFAPSNKDKKDAGQSR